MPALHLILLIIAGIFALLLILLLIPVVVAARYSDEFSLRVTYLFIPFFILSGKKKKRKKSKKTARKKTIKKKAKKAAVSNKKGSKKAKKESPVKRILKDRGLGGALKLLGRVAKLAGGAFSKILMGVRVTRFDLEILVGGEDAAAAAINYGKICAAVYPAVSLISQRTRSFRKNVSIQADFLSGKTVVYHKSRWVITPLLVLIHALGALIKFSMMEAKSNNK